jgi:hypothetical protein
MPASTVATGSLASQRSAVPGGSVAASASFNGFRAEWMTPSWPVNSSRNRSSRRQSGHRPGCGLLSQTGQSGKTGRVQLRQSGSAMVPDRISARRPQRAQQPDRRWQDEHHDSPVSRETPHGRNSWQIEHSRVGSGGQEGQSGPSGVRVFTTRQRPQFTQSSRLAGALTRQFGQIARPRSSREAASQTRPQPEQGSARDLATQLRQSLTP